MNSELLPLGTVVKVKNVEKKAFIVGFLGKDSAAPEKTYDYICYTYPEGFMNRDFTIMLNREDVESVCYNGYVTSESQELGEKINEYINNNLNG